MHAALISARAGKRLALVKGQPCRLADDVGNSRLRCLAGRIWVTRAGDPCDYILAPGQQLLLAGAGRIVLEALTGRAEIRHEPSSD